MISGELTGILGAVASVLGGITIWRKSHAEAVASKSSQVEEHMGRQDARIRTLETRIERAEERERLLVAYIFELQLHINMGGKPPGPPWPAALLPPMPNKEGEEK